MEFSVLGDPWAVVAGWGPAVCWGAALPDHLLTEKAGAWSASMNQREMEVSGRPRGRPAQHNPVR